MHYNTISVLKSHTAQYTTTIRMCTVSIQFQYYSKKVTVVYSQLTVVYCTTLMYITSLYMYCIVDIKHDKYIKLHVM